MEYRASGGLVTQVLLHMLRTKNISGALVTSRGEAGGHPSAMLATTEDQVRRCADSRYSLFPWGLALRKLLKAEHGKYAIVGLPCQIHGLYKAMQVVPQLAEKITFVIGLFCAMNVMPEATHFLLCSHKINPHDVEEVEFRNGPWPGSIVAWLKNGSNVQLFPRELNDSNQSITFLKWAYGQRRCLLCPDVPNVLADISVGDPWIRGGDGHFVFENGGGWTVTICRTQTGLNILRDVEQAREIECRWNRPEVLLPSKIHVCPSKRRSVVARIEHLRRKGRPYPDYGLTDPNATRTVLDRSEEALWEFLHQPLIQRVFTRLMFSPLGFRLAALNAFRKRFMWQHRKARGKREAVPDV